MPSTFPVETSHHASDDRLRSASLPQSEARRSTEYSNDYHIRDLPPAILSSQQQPGVTSLDEDEGPSYLRQVRKHQRSLTELFPQFPSFSSAGNTSPTRSPIKEISKKEFEDEFMPTLTGDREGIIKVSDKSRGGVSSWFSGSSAPISLGVPMGPDQHSPSRTPRRPTISSMDGMTAGRENATPSSSTSLFGGFFSPKPKSPSMRNSQRDVYLDELITFDIEQALFPYGPPNEYTFSPAAFKNLLQNAEGLVSKMQSALRERTQALHELAVEKSAKDEEYEEAEIRAKSLKTQLEQVATDLAEKERVNAELVQALAIERNARAEETRARESSIKLIKEQAARDRQRLSDCDSEDLGFSLAARDDTSSITPTRGNRSSYGSTDISEDEGASVFSRSRSSTSLNSSAVTASNASIFSSSDGQSILSSATAEIGEAHFARVVHVSNPSATTASPSPAVKHVRQKSTLQKVLAMGGAVGGSQTCKNCEGRDASFAWDTVGVLRGENKGLKERVETLEREVDGALDIVMGLGLP